MIKALMKDHAETIDYLVWQLIDLLESTDWLSLSGGYVLETPTILNIAESIEEYVK